jgi:hypothetical protein
MILDEDFYKNRALILYESDDPVFSDLLQTHKLVEELIGLTDVQDKRLSKADDAVDALRYALSKVPFDWDLMAKKALQVSEINKNDEYDPSDRRRVYQEQDNAIVDETIEQEIEFWQSQLEI